MLDRLGVLAMIDVEIEQIEEEIEAMLRNYPADEQVSIRTGMARLGARDHERLCREKCARLLVLRRQLSGCGG